MHGPFEHKNKIQKISILTPTFCFVLTSAKLIFSLNKRTALVQLLRGKQLSRPTYPAVLQGRGFASSLSKGGPHEPFVGGSGPRGFRASEDSECLVCGHRHPPPHPKSQHLTLSKKERRRKEKKRKPSLPLFSEIQKLWFLAFLTYSPETC